MRNRQMKTPSSGAHNQSQGEEKKKKKKKIRALFRAPRNPKKIKIKPIRCTRDHARLSHHPPANKLSKHQIKRAMRGAIKPDQQ
jgi:hypothetical protein